MNTLKLQDDSHLHHGCIFILSHLRERGCSSRAPGCCQLAPGSLSGAFLWKNCLGSTGRKDTWRSSGPSPQSPIYLLAQLTRLPNCTDTPGKWSLSAPCWRNWERLRSQSNQDYRGPRSLCPPGLAAFLPPLVRRKFPWKGPQSFQDYLENLQHAYPFICIFLPNLHNCLSARYIEHSVFQ